MPDKILNDLDPAPMIYGKGTINAADDDLIIDIRAAANARISFNGTFTGILEVTGFDDFNEKIRGGRLLFLSGYNSSGQYTLEGKGNPINIEGAICGGSRYLSIRPISWTSGSVEVGIVASQNPFMVFINGAVHDSDEEAVRSGRAFLAGVSNLEVTSGDKLDFVLENPIDSGVNLHLTERLFGHDSSQVLRYRAFAGITVDLPETVTPVNRSIGNTRTSSAIFKYEIRAAGAGDIGAIEGSGEPIHPNEIRERKLLVILPPGTKIGFSINGSGNNLANAAQLYATLQWFEEPTY